MKKKLKVALVSESFCYTSGVGVVMKMLIRFFRSMNIETILIGPRHNGSENWHANECHWLPSKQMKSRGYCRTSVIAPENNEAIIKILSDVDIVFCESISTLVLRIMMLRRNNKISSKVVFHAHTMADKYLFAWYGVFAWPLVLLLIKPITWLCLSNADLRITPSQFFADYLAKAQWFRRSIQVWSAPIDISPSSTTNQRAETAIKRFKSKNGIVFVVNGRVGNEKRSLDLIKLTLLLREKGLDCGLVFVGGGEIDFFKKKINVCADDHFLFLGKLPRDQGIAINKLCDIGISIATTETQSLSFLEQMAMGLPMVTQDNTVMASYVREADCGLVMPDSSMNNMANCLLAFCLKRDDFQGYGQRAKKYVSKCFSEAKQKEKLKQIIKKLVPDWGE